MPHKYIVLDRDGVINVDLFDYVLKNETFEFEKGSIDCLLYTSPSPRDATLSRMPSSA